MVALLAAIALASSIAFGGQAWTEVIFVVVTLAMSVPLRATPAAIVLVAVVAAAAALAHGGSDAMSAFMMAVTILMAGFMALLLRRGRLLISELRPHRARSPAWRPPTPSPRNGCASPATCTTCWATASR